MLQSKAGYIDARPLTASSAKPLATRGRTIHVGQTRTSARIRAKSVHPPTADMRRRHRHVGFVPTGDIGGSAGNERGRPTEVALLFVAPSAQEEQLALSALGPAPA